MTVLDDIKKMLAGMLDELFYAKDDLNEALKEIKEEGKDDADFYRNYGTLMYELDALSSYIAEIDGEIKEELDYDFVI